MSNVAAVTEEIVRPVIEQMGYELVDVEYVKEFQEWFLNIYIDKEGGISLEDCEKVSVATDSLIEAADPTKGEKYFFSVSSPGLDRPLKKPRDFESSMGKKVEVHLYKPQEGKKVHVGVLSGANTDEVTIEAEKQMVFKAKDISLVKLFIEFN